MTWLITGGAGYIGAHVVRAMTDAGERVVVLDDLSAGVPARLPEGVPLVSGSALDGDLLTKVLTEHGATGVLHLAARKQPGESVEQPTRYYRENLGDLRRCWTPSRRRAYGASSSPRPRPSTATRTWTSSPRTRPAPP